MTISELAIAFGVDSRIVTRYVNKLFPDKIKNGVQTFLNENESTQIKLDLEKNKHLDTSVKLPKTQQKIKELRYLAVKKFQKIQEEKASIKYLNLEPIYDDIYLEGVKIMNESETPPFNDNERITQRALVTGKGQLYFSERI